MGQYKDVPRNRGWLDDKYHADKDGEGEPVYEELYPKRCAECKGLHTGVNLDGEAVNLCAACYQNGGRLVSSPRLRGFVGPIFDLTPCPTCKGSGHKQI